MREPDLLPLDPEVQSLLDGERDVPGAPSGARDRVYAKVAITVGLAGLGAAAAGTAAGAGSAPLAAGGSLLKLGLVGLIGALVGGGLIYGLMRADHAPHDSSAIASAAAPAETMDRPQPLIA